MISEPGETQMVEYHSSSPGASPEASQDASRVSPVAPSTPATSVGAAGSVVFCDAVSPLAEAVSVAVSMTTSSTESVVISVTVPIQYLLCKREFRCVSAWGADRAGCWSGRCALAGR
jgi:hypothetical protein